MVVAGKMNFKFAAIMSHIALKPLYCAESTTYEIKSNKYVALHQKSINIVLCAEAYPESVSC